MTGNEGGMENNVWSLRQAIYLKKGLLKQTMDCADQ